VAAGRYVVQLGAFRNAAAAQSMRDQLAAELERAPELAGLLGTLRVASEGGLHRIWLGAAGTAAEAGALAARIRAATGRDTFVTRP
jgi:cell division septation protein DedD